MVTKLEDIVGISCALTRLEYEAGMPKLFLIDKDSGLIATLRDAKVEMPDASLSKT